MGPRGLSAYRFPDPLSRQAKRTKKSLKILLTLGHLYYIIWVTQTKEVNLLGTKKIGRPTDNPKPYRMAVKYDEECKQILEAYCKQENVNRMEAARRGIKKLKDDLKK